MSSLTKIENKKGLRVIRTARDIDSINIGVRNGYTPILKKVETCEQLHSSYRIYRSKKTGEMKNLANYTPFSLEIEMGEYCKWIDDWEIVLEGTYYPYQFNSPYAAYLIPKDIRVGEEVFVEDLIENYIGERLSTPSKLNLRLESCEAIWNGAELEFRVPNFFSTLVFVV